MKVRDWNVLEEMAWIRSQVDRFFRRVALPGQAETSEPLLDVLDGPEALHVVAEMPGISVEDFTLTLDRGRLVLEGAKRERSEGGRLRFLLLERQFGGFRRVVELPCSVQAAQVTARLRDGVLLVVLPKVVEQRRSRVSIPVEVAE